MALPQPIHVAESVARLWPTTQIQHAYLLLTGIAQALRSAPRTSDEIADRLDRKAGLIELESAELLRILRTEPDGIPGDALSLRVCALLACASEPTFADALGVPLAVVLAGRQRMLALASELVAKGLSGA